MSRVVHRRRSSIICACGAEATVNNGDDHLGEPVCTRCWTADPDADLLTKSDAEVEQELVERGIDLEASRAAFTARFGRGGKRPGAGRPRGLAPGRSPEAAALIDGRVSVCVGHLSDCDCEACRTVRRAIADVEANKREG